MTEDQSVRLSVADTKARFSELLSRVQLKGERFVIERHGRPVAALIGLEDLDALVNPPKPRLGGLGLIGAIDDDAVIDALVADIYASRRKAKDRPPPTFDD